MNKRAVMMAMMIILAISSTAFGDGIEHAEFDGIWFKTRYQKHVEIKTPIVVDMEKKTRLLKFKLRDPSNAKIKFLAKITPMDFKVYSEFLKNGDVHFVNANNAYFLPKKSSVQWVPIDILTINIDIRLNQWIEKYRDLIAENFKKCVPSILPNGYQNMECPPLWIEAQIIKIERSLLSPSLPETLRFPHLDYIDIYIKILNIKKK